MERRERLSFLLVSSGRLPRPRCRHRQRYRSSGGPNQRPDRRRGASLLGGEWRRLFVTCHLQLQPPSLSALPPLEKGLFFTPRERRERGGEGHRPTDREATGMDGGGMMKASSFPPTGGGGGAHIRTRWMDKVLKPNATSDDDVGGRRGGRRRQ